jgi:hypothetical protein
VEGAESIKVPNDLADIGGVIGDDSTGDVGRMIAENLCGRSGDKARGALGMP